MQRRYRQLANSHLQASQSVASGVHAVGQASTSLAFTKGAYRFLNNDRVALGAMALPLFEAARQGAGEACDRYALVVHDWSQLMYDKQAQKKDRIALSSRRVPEGYELQTSLLVSDRDGSPLAPLTLSLRAEDGVHCSRSSWVRRAESPLDELLPTMTYLDQQALGRPLVHIIDAEADSVGHFRQWSQAGQRFLVRADNRLVEYAGQECSCSAICQLLRSQGKFRRVREVRYHGRKAVQSIAEASVTLTRPAQRNRPKAGDRRKIPGPPLNVRLVVAEVRDPQGVLLATWYLLSNVENDVTAEQIALWYYWRWLIEKFFKLIKSAGLQVELWGQQSAAAIAKRLMVASMACVTVWELARSVHPRADEARRFLVRLSGRQMKHKTPFTIPALLAGMWVLLAMLDALETCSISDLQAFAALILPRQPP